MNRPIPITRDTTGLKDRIGLMVRSCGANSHIKLPEVGYALQLARYYPGRPAPVKTGSWTLYKSHWRIVP